jgi:predicted GNAT family acetyltransferase
MMQARELPPVVDNTAAGRFEVVVDGQVGALMYRRHGERLVLVHTDVPDALSGRGIGGALVKAAIARAADADLTVVPICPFARRWLRQHPDVASQVAIDWSTTDH